MEAERLRPKFNWVHRSARWVDGRKPSIHPVHVTYLVWPKGCIGGNGPIASAETFQMYVTRTVWQVAPSVRIFDHRGSIWQLYRLSRWVAQRHLTESFPWKDERVPDPSRPKKRMGTACPAQQYTAQFCVSGWSARHGRKRLHGLLGPNFRSRDCARVSLTRVSATVKLRRL